MLQRLKKWLAPKTIEPEPEIRYRTAVQRHKKGPSTPPPVRSQPKYIREDAGTHDRLQILDESLIDTDDDTTDPYNSGRFDRSKNWSGRFK